MRNIQQAMYVTHEVYLPKTMNVSNWVITAGPLDNIGDGLDDVKDN